jgi:putative dehydrogenase
MTIRIGMIGTGEMGSGLAGVLAASGATVATSLTGRSAASRERTARVGVVDAGDLAALVRTSTILLSVVPPDQAQSVAESFVELAAGKPDAPLFVDCNAIAPDTAKRIAAIVTGAGLRFLDAGIIGGAPRSDYSGPQIYASGPDVAEFDALNQYGLHVRPMSATIGDASAIKMCYAGISKGITGIGTAMYACAEQSGIQEAFLAELSTSQPELFAIFSRQIPAMYPKAYRWVAEMLEIGSFASADPAVESIYQGFSKFYAAIAEARTANERA